MSLKCNNKYGYDKYIPFLHDSCTEFVYFTLKMSNFLVIWLCIKHVAKVLLSTKSVQNHIPLH